MNTRSATAAALALLLTTGTAAAQDPIGALIAGQPPVTAPATPAAEEADTVSALVVTAVRPGPAFWKVADGDSVVWVMGIPSALPKDVTWNKTELKAHLRDANVLINGASGVTFNPINFLQMLFTMRRFRGDKPLDQVIPAPLMARYNHAMDGIDGQSPEQRQRFHEFVSQMDAGYAGFMLSGMFQRSLKMESGQPEDSIAREALFRVRAERVGRSNVIDMLRLIEMMPPATQQTCIDDAIKQVEGGKDRAIEAAKGWARGDLRVALSAERGFERCLASYPEITAETARNNEAVTKAILDALKRPGKSVAIADLRPLLARDGILVRLMASPGVTVTTPDVPGLEGEIGYRPEDAEP